MAPPFPSANDLIQRLKLEPLPHEGGYFARTWTSAETLPDGRPTGTAILFLVTETGFSALHAVDADEVWQFLGGDPLLHVQFPLSGPVETRTLGSDFAAGHEVQLVARKGLFQGARLAPGTQQAGWALVGCTMAPGWQDQGFVLGSRETLTARYPAAAELIRSLTRTAG